MVFETVVKSMCFFYRISKGSFGSLWAPFGLPLAALWPPFGSHFVTLSNLSLIPNSFFQPFTPPSPRPRADFAESTSIRTVPLAHCVLDRPGFKHFRLKCLVEVLCAGGVRRTLLLLLPLSPRQSVPLTWGVFLLDPIFHVFKARFWE